MTPEIKIHRYGSGWEASVDFGETKDSCVAGNPFSALEEILRRHGNHFGYIAARTLEAGFDPGRSMDCDVRGCHLHTGPSLGPDHPAREVPVGLGTGMVEGSGPVDVFPKE